MQPLPRIFPLKNDTYIQSSNENTRARGKAMHSLPHHSPLRNPGTNKKHHAVATQTSPSSNIVSKKATKSTHKQKYQYPLRSMIHIFRLRRREIFQILLILTSLASSVSTIAVQTIESIRRITSQALFIHQLKLTFVRSLRFTHTLNPLPRKVIPTTTFPRRRKIFVAGEVEASTFSSGLVTAFLTAICNFFF